MIDAETLAEWKADAGTRHAYRRGDTPITRILALIAEVEQLQEAHRSTRTLAEWNADQASVTAERCNKACAERDALQAQVDAVRALFSGGPDTSCRTTWREVEGNWACGSEIECVEVPLDALRAALGESGDTHA